MNEESEDVMEQTVKYIQIAVDHTHMGRSSWLRVAQQRNGVE